MFWRKIFNRFFIILKEDEFSLKGGDEIPRITISHMDSFVELKAYKVKPYR